MALEQYGTKLSLGGNEFWLRPKTFTLPPESSKYIQTKWVESYSWFRLSYLVYGTVDLYWLLMAVNNITDPYSIRLGDSVSILLPAFLNEVV